MLEGLRSRCEEVPFECYGGCEMWFRVWYREDLLGWTAEGPFVEVDL